MHSFKSVIILFFCLACTTQKNETDEEYIERALAKFPTGDFYRKWAWKLENGAMIDTETSLDLIYEAGDTSIYVTLRATIDEDPSDYFRRLQVLILKGDRKERILVNKETDTVYHFSVPRDFLFSFQPIDTVSYSFISGKHRFMYESLYYDSCQSMRYLAKKDSLSKVRGNVNQLPKCKP